MAKAKAKTTTNNYRADISMSDEDFLNEYVFGDVDKKLKEVDIPPIETGLIPLDIILHGGIRLGDIIMFYSGEGVGKSTICLQLSRKMIEKHNKKVLYIDVESGVRNQIEDFKLKKHLEDRNFNYIDRLKSVDEIEKLFDGILAKKELPFDVLILDSISNVIPSTLLTRSVVDPMMAGQAKEITSLLQKYRVLFKERGIIFLIINQERANLKAQTKYDPAFKVAGCKAIVYTPDVTIKLSNGEPIKENRKTINGIEEIEVGRFLKAVAIKNRKGNGKITVQFPIRFGAGISNVMFLAKMLKDKGYVKTAGAYTKTSLLPNPKGGEWSLKGKAGLEEWVDQNYDAINAILKSEGAFELMISKDVLDVTDEEVTVENDDDFVVNF